MNIPSKIKELILKNECIILPGFGGFETRYRPAAIDRLSGKLTPPSKEVVFREEYKKDNGVLQNFIQDKEKVSFEEAGKVIEKYVLDLQKKLDAENRVEIEGVGVLIRQLDGKIFFKPIESENYLMDSFGLSEVKLPPENIKNENEKEVPVFEEYVPARSNRSIMWITLVSIFVTILIVISIETEFVRKLVSLTGIEFPEEKTEKTVFGKMKGSADTLTGEIERELDENTALENALRYTEPETASTEEIPAQQNPQPVYTRKYLIVAGSFMLESYAVKQSNKLKKQGYTPEILRTKNGQFRVILNSYTDKDLAIAELEKYRNNLGPNIWLWADC